MGSCRRGCSHRRHRIHSSSSHRREGVLGPTGSGGRHHRGPVGRLGGGVRGGGSDPDNGKYADRDGQPRPGDRSPGSSASTRRHTMTISVGDRIPDVQVMTFGAGGPTHVQTADVLGAGKVVLFAVPGAFTPTCSDYHLPGYVIRAGELRAKGVDTVACLSVNDPYVMDAWGDDQEVGDAVVMLADGNGTFTRAMGLESDKSGAGLGTRSQ